MVLGVIACVVAACSLALAVWNYTASLEKLKKEDLGPLLSKSAEDLSKDYDRRLRAIEVEWDNMFDKFSKLAGRIDRRRALEAQAAPPPASPEVEPLTRSEILRRFKRK